MAHIVYGGKNYPIRDEDVDSFREGAKAALLSADKVYVARLANVNGYVSELLISQGAPVVINHWDTDQA
jgi:hypothetical protein